MNGYYYGSRQLQMTANLEVGEPVDIGMAEETVRATWLGVVGENGWTLADAMRLMAEMEAEREGLSPPASVP